MSVNNYLLIRKTKKGKYNLTHRDADTGHLNFGRWEDFNTLEEAVKTAIKFEEENEVEYGIKFYLEVKT